MAFFQFGRKIEYAKEYSLESIPVFSSLTAAELKMIEKKARLSEYKRGDLVYEENTPPDAFYVVISGRFRLYHKSRPGRPEKTLLYFHRGDHFSETSLLTGRMHSATVEAKRDGMLLKLDKDDFLKLVNDFPAISLHLNRSLGHRLTKVQFANDPQEVKIATLYSCGMSPSAFNVWKDFAAAIVKETKKRLVLVDFFSPFHERVKEDLQSGFSSFILSDMDPSKESDLKPALVKHPAGFNYLHVVHSDKDEKDEKKVSSLINFLTYRHDYLLLRLSGDLTSFVFKALKQSDMVYAHSAGNDLEEMAQALTTFQQGFGFSKSEIRVLMANEAGKDQLSFESKEDLIGTRIFSLLPTGGDSEGRYREALRYAAKEFAGTLLGLALGSGAAYGLAHIGVLKALERAGIAPDVIAGSSIGALVGAFWAAGFSSSQLADVARTIEPKTSFFKLLGFQDMSIAHRGFFKGNQVVRWLESYLGNQTFQDLKMPLKIIAANLFTSEEVILDTGRVVDAVRASISIPGIFRPVFHKNVPLIDGGVVDPLPVRVLASMGVKKIIAVNVLPGSKDRIERNRIREAEARRKAELMASKSSWNRLFSRSANKVYNHYAVNIFNVIMSTIQFLEHEIAEVWGRQADIMIHPIVREAHWAEFYSPDKFIKLGEEKTEELMDDIKRLLVE